MVTLTVTAALLLASLAEGALVNRNVIRRVNLQGAMVKLSTGLLVENDGEKTESEYVIQSDSSFPVAYISVKDRKTEELLSLTEGGKKGGKEWRVQLSPPLGPGESIKLTVDMSVVHAIKPLPARQDQIQPQKLVYEDGSVLFPSPYRTDKQKTVVVLPNVQVESYSEGPSPVQLKGNEVTYGPYEETEALEGGNRALRVHYTHTLPPLTCRTGGGNLAVEEHVDLRHDGAAIDGQFSRLDFQRSAATIPQTAAVLSVPVLLPAMARDIYYRDAIGNVSTSRLLGGSTQTQVMELRPRFPLFGGWKYQWYYGYNTPLSTVVRRVSEGSYALRVNFVEPHSQWTVDEAEVRIVLPEGASNIRINVPFHGVDVQRDSHSTYLDSTGRPTIWLRATHVVEDHAQTLEVLYDFPETQLLQKPLVVAMAIFSLFLGCTVLSRVPFSIARK
ncbi:Ribophorin I [Piptocephalis cylindrospora]|uniref:Dolichyl-diphosphooligosaccharide--protein glycosyltransferase subunit 1 n=1 Tax=Piptocephalis cylindrospora TaxID=1907219 RepID=A0A4P9XZZ0_9FUNG|nr:Ribophorin I [Piptocephalis cylindrospora]|eukprot:RKP12063.1 Ribophorin I [Piptocephalis cylindrospora]